MDLFTILGATFRRWYVTLPVLLVAGYLAYQSYQSVPAVYSSSVSVTVLKPVEPPPPPPDPETGEIVKPYEANPYSGPDLAAAVLARNLNSAAFEDALGLNEDRNQTVEADPARDEPIIQVIATAESPAAVGAILEEVTIRAGTILDAFQAEAGATEGARYKLAPAVPADVVEDVTPSRLRTAGAIVVMGLGVAAALATLLDMALERRAARRPRHPAPTRTSPTARTGGRAFTDSVGVPAARAGGRAFTAAADAPADRAGGRALAGPADAPSARPGDEPVAVTPWPKSGPKPPPGTRPEPLNTAEGPFVARNHESSSAR